MSTVEKTARWMEWASDWLNPILVKETRQALKSRQFVATFLLLLVASWFFSVFGLLMAGDAVEYGSAGQQFFSVFYVVLAIATLVIVPSGAFRSLQAERDQNTFELLSITALSPRQIVWGKLLSAFVQVLLYYSAISPFIAFTSLLQGFDLAHVAFVLVISMLASLVLSMTALMLSSLVRGSQGQALMSLAAFAGLVFGFFSLTAFILRAYFGMGSADFWWVIGSLVLVGASYFALFEQITTSRLTFEAGNRTSGIRFVCMVQFWLLWLSVFFYFWWESSTPPSELFLGLTGVSVAHWSIVGLYAVTERDTLSRRIRRELPRTKLTRLLWTPLLPGGSRGLLLLVLQLGALWLMAVGALAFWRTGGTMLGPLELVIDLFTFSRSGWMRDVQTVTAMCCYPLFYLGIAAGLARWGRSLSKEINHVHIRVFALLIFAAGVIGPYLFKMLFLHRWDDYSGIDITNPFETVGIIARGYGGTGGLVTVVVAATLSVVLLNVRALARGVGEIVSDETIQR
jgi:ABC-type transport system involved in multi-copper enzyme maturation permease subunit